ARVSSPTSTRDAWLVGLDVVLVVGLCAAAVATWPSWKGIIRVAALGALAATLGAACWALVPAWHEGFADFYSVPDGRVVAVKMGLSDPKSTKACTLLYKDYPFFGSQREFRVCSPLWMTDETKFRSYVWERGVTHVVMGRHDPHWVKPFERVHHWVLGRPG